MENGNLERQKGKLISYCNEKGYKIINIFEETASGLNDSRRELIKMFKRLEEVNAIIIEYPDRLARFGYNYLNIFANSLGVNIESIQDNKKLEPNEEMVQDLIRVVTCFSAKLYSARGGRKLKKTIEELEKEREAVYEDNNTSNTIPPVIFGSKEMFMKKCKGNITSEEWKACRNNRICSRGDKTKKGNPNLRVVIINGMSFIEISTFDKTEANRALKIKIPIYLPRKFSKKTGKVNGRDSRVNRFSQRV